MDVYCGSLEAGGLNQGEVLADGRRECPAYHRKALLVAFTQRVRICPIRADGEIRDHHQSRCVASNAWCVADAPDVVHVGLTAPARQDVDHLALQRLNPGSPEIVDRPLGVLEHAMEDGGAHRARCGVATERLGNVDAVSEEQATRAVAARSVHASSEHDGVSKLHALTLRAAVCRDTPVRGKGPPPTGEMLRATCGSRSRISRG